MKKASLETLVKFLNGEEVSGLDTIKAEIEAELAKGKAKADANRAVYADMHDAVIEAIRVANAPVTAQDIADATGLARGKVVYGLTNLWADEIVKDDSGKANLYTLA